MAVDQTSGDVYVADTNNQRIEKLTATGGFLMAWGWGVADGVTSALQTCTVTCFAGIEGSGAGQFDYPEGGLAVDNSTNLLDMSVGDVYVVDSRNQRVEKFNSSGVFLLMFGGEVNETTKGDVCLAGEKCKAGTEGSEPGQFDLHTEGTYIAVGSTGTVYVGDEDRVQEFSPEGVYQSQITLAGAGQARYLAVDGAENTYVNSTGLNGIQEYNPSDTLIRTLDSEGSPESPALDTSGDLFIAENGPSHRIFEYDPSGILISSFDSGGSSGMAFGDTAGKLYVVEGDTVRIVTPPPPGPLVEPASESASEVQRTAATLNATVDPENHEAGSSEQMSYHFEYGETESYDSSTPPETSIGNGFEDRPLSAGLEGLQPRTTYHFRVVATNAAHETTDGPDEEFTTLPAALIDSESTAHVTSSSVTLGAQIDPLGSNTEYRFEYDTRPYENSARHGTSVPIPNGDIVARTGDVTIDEHLQNLLPETVYHYRVVALNGLGMVEGADHTFTTQPPGESPVLADNRQWELVSPPDKHGATIQSFAANGVAMQASERGDAFTYAANAPTEANPPGSVAPERVQVLSTHGGGGGGAGSSSSWPSRDIATPHDEPTAEPGVGHQSEYVLFSNDLSLGAVQPFGETPLSPEASEQTPYLRNNVNDSYQPLITTANSSGAKFAKEVEVAGAAPDLRHIVVISGVPLAGPLSGSGPALYEWAGGAVQPVSVLPGSESASGSAALGDDGVGTTGIVRHAISNDGSRVIWESKAEHHLYLRDMSRKETVQLDVVENGARGGVGAPVFQTASNDGSKIFFIDQSRLTVGSKRGGDLYEYEVTGPGVVGRLRDLNVGGVSGVVIGASEDGSYVYLVDGSVLTGVENGKQEKAAPGADNLYVLHDDGTEWTPTFIARLSSEDRNDWEAGDGQELNHLTSRISPDGRWLAFMSDRSLTGYDNHDANSGEPDEEVFLYGVESGLLVCASCNPTGARPAGILDPKSPRPLVDVPQLWPERWLAGVIPGWTPDRDHLALYQSRYLSDGGRLFFDSSDALVPQDVNGKEDVYGYEPVGDAETAASDHCAATSSGYSSSSDGCVSLISSGTSDEESVFLDASENGDDVFFLTAARLVPEDVDASLDVYDAHVCSTVAPCSPRPSEVPPACTDSDSCRAAPSPQPSIFGPPASATFSGAGNVTPAVATPPKKATKKTVKCKRGFVKSKKGKCVRKKSRTKAKRAGSDRRAGR